MEKNWSLGATMRSSALGFSLSDRETESSTNQTDPNQVRYVPNHGGKAVIHGGYKEYQVSYGFSMDPDEETVADKGKSKQTDISFSYAQPKWIGELFFKDYSGFYVESGSQTPRLRPDIKAKFMGAILHHSFTEEYSLKPLHDLEWSENGDFYGWTGTLQIEQFKFSGDQPVLSRNGFVSLDQTAINAGGTYSGYRSTDHYLIGGSLGFTLGPEFHSAKYVDAGSAFRKDGGLGYTFGFLFDLKAAYKWTDFLLGADLKMNLISTYIGDTGIQADGFDFGLFGAWRF